MIGRSNRIGAIGAIDTNPTFAFANSPLERVEKKTNDKENEELRKNDVEGLLFFGSKLGFNVSLIFVDFGMVVVLDPSLKLRRMTHELAHQGHASSSDALGARKISRR
jgi:hypothetical protein